MSAENVLKYMLLARAGAGLAGDVGNMVQGFQDRNKPQSLTLDYEATDPVTGALLSGEIPYIPGGDPVTLPVLANPNNQYYGPAAQVQKEDTPFGTNVTTTGTARGVRKADGVAGVPSLTQRGVEKFNAEQDERVLGNRKKLQELNEALDVQPYNVREAAAGADSAELTARGQRYKLDRAEQTDPDAELVRGVNNRAEAARGAVATAEHQEAEEYIGDAAGRAGDRQRKRDVDEANLLIKQAQAERAQRGDVPMTRQEELALNNAYIQLRYIEREIPRYKGRERDSVYGPQLQKLLTDKQRHQATIQQLGGNVGAPGDDVVGDDQAIQELVAAGYSEAEARQFLQGQ